MPSRDYNMHPSPTCSSTTMTTYFQIFILCSCLLIPTSAILWVCFYWAAFYILHVDYPPFASFRHSNSIYNFKVNTVSGFQYITESLIKWSSFTGCWKICYGKQQLLVEFYVQPKVTFTYLYGAVLSVMGHHSWDAKPCRTQVIGP